MAPEKKNNRWFGYATYFVLVTALLLYVLFPGPEIARFLNSSLAGINPELSFRAGKIRPWFSPGVRITAGQVYHSSMPELPLLEVDTMTVSPEMAKLLRGEESRFDLSGEAYGGDISGSIQFAGNGAGQMDGTVVFRNFAMEEYRVLALQLKHAITGRLSGKVEFSDSGRVELRLEDGMLQFKEPFLTIESFDIQAFRVEAEVKRNAVTLLQADLAGPEVKGNMTGTIELNRDLSLSELNLKGTLEPLAEFYKNYPQIRDMLKAMNKKGRRGQFPFALTGTLEKPRFRLL